MFFVRVLIFMKELDTVFITHRKINKLGFGP